MKKNNKKKISPNVNKAFALASVIGASLYTNQDGNIKLNTLILQSKKAMKVFLIKTGYKHYSYMTDEVAKIFETFTEKHHNTITIDEMPAYIELLCTLIPPSNFKKFFAIAPFRTSVTFEKQETFNNICFSLLELDDRLNKLCQTSSYALPVKKIVHKEKHKKQRSIKPIKVKTKKSKVIRESKRKKSVKSFLQQRIAEARKLSEPAPKEG